MKYVRFAVLTRNNLIMIFTRYAKTSDDRNENQTENSEPPRKPTLIGPRLKPPAKGRRYNLSIDCCSATAFKDTSRAMTPRLKSVECLRDHTIRMTFEDGRK